MKKVEQEKILEQELKKRVEREGGLCLKLLSQHVTGLPDRLCLLPRGNIFFVEVKTTGKKPRKIQAIMHSRIEDLGFKVFVLDSTKVLNEIMNEHGVF